MRIAIVSGDDVVGDDPRQLAAALAAREHDVRHCVRRSGRRSAAASVHGYRTLAVPAGPTAAASASDVLPYVGEWAAALEREWASDAPDVVHAYGWLGGLAAQLAARRRDVPVVQSFLGLAATGGADLDGKPPRESEWRSIERLLARSAAWATGESSDDVDALARMRHSRARVSPLTSGVDADRYTSSGPVPASTDPHRVLCLAPNPLPRNGFDIAINAMPRVPAAELILAETDATNPDHDEARAGLRRLATELGVVDRVRFTGTAAVDKLPMLLRSADVVACTPRHPPRATTVLEAMASGVVVVALAVGVLNDVVVQNVTGLVLSTESPSGLAAALRSLLGQSFQRESMGAAGRGRAVSRYSWSRIALDSLNIYQHLQVPGGLPSRLHSSGLR